MSKNYCSRLKMQYQAQLRYIFTYTVIVVAATLSGCAGPATKEIAVNKHELKQEQQAQRDLANKSKQTKVTERKHKELSVYHTRLEKMSPKLMKAAQKVCNDSKREYKFKIADEKILNAWADGKTVNITPIMMDFLETEQELALIMSHELSHNIMGHIRKKQQNSIIGTLLDFAAATQGVDTYGAFGSIGASSYSQGFENEADYVAMYIMVNAGYDISTAHTVWRKMSVENPGSIEQSFFSSHPSNPERFIRMKKTIDEIKAKQQAGQPLMPNVG